MEFHQKLQELRKARGLTQEELAARLYVSRAAVSKWESGRGYPNIDSLKAIATAFSVTVDQLLSSDEVLTLAECHQKQREASFFDWVYAALDVCTVLFLLLPVFGQRTENAAYAVSLSALDGVQPYLKTLYVFLILATVATGILTLALRTCRWPFWTGVKSKLSLSLNVILALLFILSLQPYAAVFTLAPLAIKLLLLLRSKRY